MFYQFKQAVHFGGKDYLRGVHDVPEAVEYDPNFIKYVGAGLIVDAEAPAKAITLESSHDRSKRLHEHLVKKAADAKRAKAGKAPVAPPAPPVVPSGVEKAEAKAEQEAADAAELAKMEAEEAAAKEAEAKADADQVADKQSDQGEAEKPEHKTKKNKKG